MILITDGKPGPNNNFIQLNWRLFQKINEKVNAGHGVARTLLMLLCGFPTGFNIPEGVIMERIGANKEQTIKALKYLIELDLIEYNFPVCTVKFDVLMK